jgi:hypothetical protein
MRRRGTVLPMLLCVCLTGCFTGGKVRNAGWIERMCAPRIPLGPDGVLVDLVMIELPLGDNFLNNELWQCTDCLAIGQDKQGLLADNGLRVGPVIGMAPGELQNLLTTERHSSNQLRQILAAGHKTTFPLGPPQPACSFRLRTEGGATDVTLNQGQPTLIIEPSLADYGRIRLKFTPQVVYGTVRADYQAAPKESNWHLEYKRPDKTYSSLSWEVTLAPNQYLVIGTRFDDLVADDGLPTLGGQFFMQDTDHGCVQRVLVVRTTRGDAGLSDEWHVAKSEMPECIEQEDAAQDGTQPISPAAHCLTSP